MPRINMVIADCDKAYVNRLVNYLTEKNNQLSISFFTEIRSLISYISNRTNNINILLFSVDMYCPEIDSANISTKLILSDGAYATQEKYETVNKYQRADDFINEVLIKYASDTGNVGVMSGDKKDGTNIIAVYSPSGGCGKTVLALALARMCASNNKKTLYLNYEKINSTVNLFEKAGKYTMSEIFLEAKASGGNPGIKTMMCANLDEDAGFYYINPPECAGEYNEMTGREIAGIVSSIREVNQFDTVVIDMDNGYTEPNFLVLSECDRIVMPFTTKKVSVDKIKYFIRETRINEKLNGVSDKLILIENKSKGGADTYFEDMQIMARIPQSNLLDNFENIPYQNYSRILSELYQAAVC